jgi:hypothetical protein
MLKSLDFHRVGPAPHLGPVEFAERLNLLTGDNGLGKTFLLDAAWWSLTGSWPAEPAWPQRTSGPDDPARIVATMEGKTRPSTIDSPYDYRHQLWPLPSGRPANPGLVLYFRVDGQFSLWDPSQHYWRRNAALGVDAPDRPDALHLAAGEVWNSIPGSEGRVICRGLIEDWVTWQQTQSPEFTHLLSVVQALSPMRVEAADPHQVWAGDRRDYPFLRFGYGEVPLPLTSAGMKRILGLAYLLVWAWHGHRKAAELIRQPAENRITILFDEPETHLHPEWQRRLLPALMGTLEKLEPQLSIQMVVSTHSPLVLASTESVFEESRDAIFHLAFDDEGTASVERVPWSLRGDVSTWLVSPIFGLEQARSVEAEEAIEAAERFMRGKSSESDPSLRTWEQLDARLRKVLPGTDRFWPRWVARTERP